VTFLSVVLWARWKPHWISFNFGSFISRHHFSRHLATYLLNIWKFLKSIAGCTKHSRGTHAARGPRVWDPWSNLLNSSPLSIPQKRFVRLARHLQFRFWCLSSQFNTCGRSKKLRTLSENCCTSQFVYRICTRGAKRDPTAHSLLENVGSLCSLLKI